MNQDNNSVALVRFKSERMQKLHEMCDFIEDEIDSSATMSEERFKNVVRMCQDVNGDAFERAYTSLGLVQENIVRWLAHSSQFTPSNVSAILVARALLHELRKNIGTRPIARVPKVQATPEIVTSGKFLLFTDLDDMPEWKELSTRVRNALRNDNHRQLSDVLNLTAKRFLQMPNVSKKSLEELVLWCHKYNLRGLFFNDPGVQQFIERTRLVEVDPQ